MYFLLIILLINGNEESISTGPYENVQTCITDGKTHADALRFKCVKIKSEYETIWIDI